ncbi:MAG TPA: hypothetical protein VH230_02375 [Stellaceae bacterium]|nr:hypothetical protein [Stellaceae bacterium]
MTNHSKATIFHIQAGTPRRDDWGDDLLASDVVLPGETVAVAMDVADDRCSIDMKMVIDDGTAIVTRGIDICKTAQYEFTDDTIVAGEAGATTAS